MRTKAMTMLVLILFGLVLSQVVNAPISTWITKAPMPTERGQAVVITGDDGLIYVMGGYQGGWYGMTTVEAYNPLTDTWITKASMPHATRGAAGAKGLDGTIYVISGFDTWVQAYNPITDTWTLKAPIPYETWWAGAATGDDGKIYVIGGEVYDPMPVHGGDYVQVYDPVTDAWTLRTPMPTPRLELGVVKGSDGLIYAIGGYHYELESALSVVEAYDPVADTWTTKASLPTPLCQFGGTLGPDGKIYVIGGGITYSTPSPPFYDSVYSYDPTTDTWNTELPMPTARREVGATTWHDSIYAIGGANGSWPHPSPCLDTNEEAVVIIPAVTATIDIDPNVLNLKSNGEWITAYIELPGGYSISNIDVNTILLNGTVPVDVEAPIAVGDYDADGIPDLMVKLNRDVVIDFLGTMDFADETGKFREVTLTISGAVGEETFEGSDTVKVIL